MTQNKVNISSLRNRIMVAKNDCQGHYKKVLCVCSAGALRSPTLAEVLSQPPYNFNTRAVGSATAFALIPIEPVHIIWAEDIIVFSDDAKDAVTQLISSINECSTFEFKRTVHFFDVPDYYNFRDPELVSILKQKCEETYGRMS